MRISYGKNVYGKDEINAVVQLKKTQMGLSVHTFEKKFQGILEKIWFDGKFWVFSYYLALEVINLKGIIIIPCLNFVQLYPL